MARYFKCSCCAAGYHSDKPQDPEHDKGYGICEKCRPIIADDMVKHGFAGRDYTREQALARLEKYA